MSCFQSSGDGWWLRWVDGERCCQDGGSVTLRGWGAMAASSSRSSSSAGSTSGWGNGRAESRFGYSVLGFEKIMFRFRSELVFRVLLWRTIGLLIAISLLGLIWRVFKAFPVLLYFGIFGILWRYILGFLLILAESDFSLKKKNLKKSVLLLFLGGLPLGVICYFVILRGFPYDHGQCSVCRLFVVCFGCARTIAARFCGTRRL